MFSAEFVSETADVLDQLDNVLDKLAVLDLSAGSEAPLAYAVVLPREPAPGLPNLDAIRRVPKTPPDHLVFMEILVLVPHAADVKRDLRL